MAEAIHCPSCSTRYRLRPERVTPAIRRAQCFSCGGVFPVGELVQKLLAPPVPATTVGFTLEDVAGLQLDPPAPPDPPSLDLGDLAESEEELLEQTLIALPDSFPEAPLAEAPAPEPEPPAPPQAPAPAAQAAYPPEITEATLTGGYASARDAIEKLFAGSPAAAAPAKSAQDAAAMDMEATLSALENTLSGAAPAPQVGDSPTASGLSEDDLKGPSESTMRLTQAELQAMIASQSPAASEATQALRAGDPPAPQAVPADSPTQRLPPPAPTDGSDTGAELLRLKIGEEVYGNLTMGQLIAWVGEGRILENHLVARQHSENWLEAHKVPGLRPVFERLRRERSGGVTTLPQDAGESGPKKSLFGGLFGKA